MENKENITEIVFILDRSGSMSGLESDTIGGFNGFIRRQQEQEGKAFLTTVLFDDEYELLHDRLPLGEVKQLTKKDYYVRGCTALLDAMGRTIEHIGNIHKYAREEDRPAKTIVVITTDGLENASRKYNVQKIKKLVAAKQESGWEFIFLGANMDAIGAAADIGIDAEHAATYRCDEKGTALNFDCVGEALCDMRASILRCAVPAMAGKSVRLSKKWKKDIEDYEKGR